MSELGQPPFPVQGPDIARVQGGLAELGLADAPYRVVGVTALHLEGLVQYAGRTDIFTTPDEYDRLRSGTNEFASGELGHNGAKNRRLVFSNPTPGGLRPVHIMTEWEPADAQDGTFTYENLQPETEDVHGIHVVNPVTSIKWLLALGYERDRTAAVKALQLLRTVNPPVASTLYDRSQSVWPKYH